MTARRYPTGDAGRVGAGLRRPARVLAPIVLVLALAACGGGEAADAGPLDPAAGEALYGANCAGCHGADLRGSARGPSLLSEFYAPSHHADAAFLLAVRNGARAHHWDFGDMPRIGGLSDAEVAAITAFVRAAQEREGFEPYPP